MSTLVQFAAENAELSSEQVMTPPDGAADVAMCTISVSSAVIADAVTVVTVTGMSKLLTGWGVLDPTKTVASVTRSATPAFAACAS